MRNLIILSLLLFMGGCTQPEPVQEVTSLQKKPAGMETLERNPKDPLSKSITTLDDTKIPQQENVKTSSTLVAEKEAVKEVKTPVAKTPKEIKALTSKAAEAPSKKVKKKKVQKKMAKKAPKSEEVTSKKTIIGEVEQIRVIPGDVVLKARIDTGATTTSLNAMDVQHFERDG